MVTTQNTRLLNYQRTHSGQRDTEEGRAAQAAGGTPWQPPPVELLPHLQNLLKRMRSRADGTACPTPTWAVKATFDNPLQQPPRRELQKITSKGLVTAEGALETWWLSFSSGSTTNTSLPALPQGRDCFNFSSLASLREENTHDGGGGRDRQTENERMRENREWLSGSFQSCISETWRAVLTN